MIRKIQLSVIYLLVGGWASAQTLAPSPGSNFTRKETVYVSGQTTDAQVLSLPIGSKSTTFQYADGLGRPIQSVSRQASPLQNDLVAPVIYDIKGRVSTQYLPYRITSTTGAFRSSAVSEQASFYTSPPTGVTGDSRPLSSSTYEDSPLDRVLQSTKVGTDFSNKYHGAKSLVNDASVVRKWDIVSGLPRSTATYVAGSLALVESFDEVGLLTREYSDWLGRKVLSQVQATSTTWLSTYYVYNDYNELLFIIPPSSAATFTPDAAHSNMWHFRYEYDELGREIGSKAPAAEWVYTIYDRWDRPVLTQDGIQRAMANPEWNFVKYDAHNRPVIVGTFASSSTRATLTTNVGASTGRFETQNTTAVGYSLNATFPASATEANILTIAYYDDYSFRSNTGWSNNNALYAFQAVSGFTPAANETAVKGLATGSKSRSQGTSIAWQYAVTYYDQYYQPIQTIASHQLGGTVRATSQYAFSGETEKVRTAYSYTGGNKTINRRFTYDHAGRPLKTYHQIDSEEEVLLSQYQYNELGEAIDVIHHSRNEGSTFLYKSTLKSTVQGWTDEILYRFSDNQVVFKEKLDYQKSNGASNTVKHNGLITSQKWHHYGAVPEELYNYSYNTPQQLTASVYQSKPATAWISNGLYNENNITYSSNGNITALARNRSNAGTAVQTDNLAYTYSGNRLTAVTDNAPTTYKAEGFTDGNPSGTDYQYNVNGFLISDTNKGITAITYTYQDLPSQVNFGSNTIKYTYDAGGALMNVTYQGTGGFPNKTVHYVGELVFEGTVLQDINHELGRVLANNGNKYQYYLTDHLGNSRVVLQEDPAAFTSLAGLEPRDMSEESQQFIGYEEVVRISADMLNHTEGSESSFAMRLSGGNGENIGLAKSVSVMTGDTVRMEVFGKYLDIGEAKRNPAVMAVLMAITAADPVAMGIDGALTASAKMIGTESVGMAGLLTSSKDVGDAPPAFLNYLFFDREMNYKYGGFVQMTNSAREDGTNVPHEKLAQEVVAEEPGYFYIYLSNESQTGSEAFFDDFSIMTSESYVVQQTDYYTYGMIAKNWTRIGEKATKDLFQGKTYEDLTKWYDFHARQYDAALGRWFGVDPQNQFASPYLAMGNNPVMMVDPDGEFAAFLPILAIAAKAAVIGAGVGAATYAASTAITGQSWNWNQLGSQMFRGAALGGLTAGLGAGFSAGLNAAGVGVQASNFIGGALASFSGNLAGGGMPQAAGQWAGALGGAFLAGQAMANNNPLNLSQGFDKTAKIYGSIGVNHDYISLPTHHIESLRMFNVADWHKLFSGGMNPVVAGIYSGNQAFANHPVTQAGVFAAGFLLPAIRVGQLGNVAKTGLSNAQLVQKAATLAERTIGGTGGVAGTAKHVYAKNLLSRYQSIYGNRGLSVGSNYFNGPTGKGFLDVVNHNTKTIFDFKFGKAVMSNAQYMKYSNSFPGYTIQIIKP
ncbi:DUF6443 domain-containing protein [Algoriphagus antarcticus]|uniref:RHS repeat-associated protein n=1 Tax=Algoriphagus antarcticus TaxID=238540 RepID=A0A3E0D783_9BACT|nr:DUF6443 domain-containing protein [Algoriphagus antarcticus]REG78506.1 RHS repeat-associated protein [Algoriphagus antarcticus]